MKSKRHAKILELIDKYEIETQEELADRLNESGFSVTQATISRDIRELKFSKVSGSNGRQKYVAFTKPTMEMTDKYSRVLKEGLHFQRSGHRSDRYKNGDRHGHGGGCGYRSYGASRGRRMHCRR